VTPGQPETTPAWESVVQAATRAPSIHNTQPWRFTAAEDRLEVFFDPERALPVVDPTHRQQVISCGLAVEFAVIALQAGGHEVTVELMPDGAGSDHLATLRLAGERPSDDVDRALAAAIVARHTQRSAFLPRAVPSELIDQVQMDAGAFDVWLQLISQGDAELTAVALLSRAEEVEQSEPGYREELERWMRTDPDAPDGVPVTAVPAEDPATRPSNWLVRDFLVGQRQPGPPAVVHDEDPPPPVERPAVLLMGTMADDREAWVQAGRALARVLLRITDAGLAASPLTQALDWPATRAAMEHRLNLVGHPQMLLRLGWPATAASSTGRRPVTDVLSGR
jgi:hypothetical protein